MIGLPFGEPVTVSRSAFDNLGNKQAPTTHSVGLAAFDVSVQPQRGDQPYGSVGRLFVPRGSDVVDGDIVVRGSGQRWKVIGDAQWDHVHPMTGADFGYCEYTIERA